MKQRQMKPGFGPEQVFEIAVGIKVVVDLPTGGIEPTFVPEAIADMKAAYDRCLERSWETFRKATGSKIGLPGQQLAKRATKRARKAA